MELDVNKDPEAEFLPVDKLAHRGYFDVLSPILVTYIILTLAKSNRYKQSNTLPNLASRLVKTKDQNFEFSSKWNA